MTTLKITKYEDHLWYPILVKMGGGHRIVEMQGKNINSHNDSICPRCGRIHDCPPVDTEAIIRKHAEAIAREIDAEVMRIVREKHNKRVGSDPIT